MATNIIVAISPLHSGLYKVLLILKASDKLYSVCSNGSRMQPSTVYFLYSVYGADVGLWKKLFVMDEINSTMV